MSRPLRQTGYSRQSNRGGTLRPATAIIIVILLAIIAVAGIFQLVQILNT